MMSSNNHNNRHRITITTVTHDMSVNLMISPAKKDRHDDVGIRKIPTTAGKLHHFQNTKMATQQQQQIVNRVLNHNALAFGQANTLNYLARKGNNSTRTSSLNSDSISQFSVAHDGKLTQETSVDGNGDDKTGKNDSERGHFGWATLGNTYIPYIMRQTEKYCAVRMVEVKMPSKYLSHLHRDIFKCAYLPSYYTTEAESRLFNEINQMHCDGQFGTALFTPKAVVVRLDDVHKCLQFLEVCYIKLVMGSCGPSDKCGFIRINKESVVPYTVQDNQKFLPIIYFEGDKVNKLELNATYLSGWDLSYLKFCCKVQGIRNGLFTTNSVAVISLNDIKQYFPKGSVFENYWPSKADVSQLLLGISTAQNSNIISEETQQTGLPAASPQRNQSINTVGNTSTSNPKKPTRKRGACVDSVQSLLIQQWPLMQAQQASTITAAAAYQSASLTHSLAATGVQLQTICCHPGLIAPTPSHQLAQIIPQQQEAQVQQYKSYSRLQPSPIFPKSNTCSAALPEY